MPVKAAELIVWYSRGYSMNPKEYGESGNIRCMDPIQYRNVTDLLARFFLSAYYEGGAVPNWRHECLGVMSCFFQANGETLSLFNKHMPIFDYDGKNVKKQIRQDVKLLQKEHSLGDAWIYSTKRGFHVYFFCDAVYGEEYLEMMDKVKCCKGFRKSFKAQGYAVIRVSAKYTSFDIKPLYVLRSKVRQTRRMNHKAHLIRTLLEMGQECGTHFASMFPQWARYTEDTQEWKPTKGARKNRVKKNSRYGKWAGVYGKAGLDLDGTQAQSTTTVVDSPTLLATQTAASIDSFMTFSQQNFSRQIRLAQVRKDQKGHTSPPLVWLNALDK